MKLSAWMRPLAAVVVTVAMAGASAQPVERARPNDEPGRLRRTKRMVAQARVELATPAFSVRCSTN